MATYQKSRFGEDRRSYFRVLYNDFTQVLTSCKKGLFLRDKWESFNRDAEVWTRSEEDRKLLKKYAYQAKAQFVQKGRVS